MIVVFDTNIWKANLYLRSEVAAAVNFFLIKKSAKVGLPEVVRLEVERHLREDIKKSRSQIISGHDKLLAYFGKLHEVKLPTVAEIDELIARYFDETGFDIIEIPFSYKAAKSSFLKVINKERPSGKKQEFKDCVLWENCKTLANKHNVILVTDDGGFFEEDNSARRLATSLSLEAEKCRYGLSVLPSLSDLLRDIEQPITINDQALEEAINIHLGVDIDGLLDRAGFYRSDARFETTFYATEDSNVLYVEFAAEFNCEDATGEGRTDATLRLKGNGSYSDANNSFNNLKATELSIPYVTREGEQEEKSHYYLYAEGAAFGHRTVTHVVRKKLSK